MTVASGFSELMGMDAPPVVSTTAADDRFLATTITSPDAITWSQWVDRLLEWWNHPEMIESDEGASVSRDVIETAIRSAHALSKNISPAPFAIAPDGDGGIGFHFRLNQARSHVEFLRSGHIDIYQFNVDGTLVFTKRIR